MHHHALAVSVAPAVTPLPASSGAGVTAAAAEAAAAAAATMAVSVGAPVGGVGAAAAADGLDAFVQLGLLIVEGRVAGAEAWSGGGAGTGSTRGPRGYAEGPHCTIPGASTTGSPAQMRAHQCDSANFLCSRARRLRAHLRLLWQTRLPLCVEVLAAPECACAATRAHAVDVGAPPPPPPAAAADLLLERWHVAVSPSPSAAAFRDCGAGAAALAAAEMSVRSLFSAVRSQLHFSQLAAWMSASGGARPRHVCYRLALPALSDAPGAFAASRFLRPPLEHSFPPAPLGPGGPFLQVSVKMLPRMDALPILHCPLHANGSAAERTPTILGKQVLADLPAANANSSFLGATARTPIPRVEACVSEPLLGDSLLDPPPSLQLLRGRAPRTSSPPPGILPRPLASVHVCTGRQRWRDPSPPSPPSTSLPQRRRGRQGMARRRDASSGGSTFVRAFKSGVESTSGDLLDDRMLNPCTRPGKHHCRCAYEDDPTDCVSSPVNGIVGSSSGINSASNSRSEDILNSMGSSSSGQSSKPSMANTQSSNRKLSLELSQSEVEEVLAVLRGRNPSTRSSNHCSKNSVLPSLVCKQADTNTQSCEHHTLPSTSISQESFADIYHSKPSTSTSKTAHKADLLLDAILRAQYPAKNLSPDLKGYDPDERVTKDRTKGPIDNSFRNSESESLLKVPKKTSSSSVPLLYRRLGQIRGRHSPPPQLHTLEISKSSVSVKEHLRNPELLQLPSASQTVTVPSAQETALFRRSLRSAACMVFHCRTGLPLTSSPAPVRRRHDSARFDFDSSLNSVSAIRSALFEASGSPKNGETLNVNDASSPNEDSEASVGSPVSPGVSPQALSSSMKTISGQMPWPPRCHISHCSSLLGSFEESVLNGRLEPVSTVQGFTADLGASGTFCPRHLLLPVTVFFYTLGDNDKVSTPYLGHINLGKKGYTVPRVGTIQVTLLNPLGTVVKMFVVQYDLSDMPPQATTFLRQRTLYLPANSTEYCGTDAPMHCLALQKHLRYLIHLRFSSSRSGRISLHTDIRMIIFRKSDLDTATAHDGELAYELRSFTHGPTNPKFSPRK